MELLDYINDRELALGLSHEEVLKQIGISSDEELTNMKAESIYKLSCLTGISVENALVMSLGKNLHFSINKLLKQIEDDDLESIKFAINNCHIIDDNQKMILFLNPLVYAKSKDKPQYDIDEATQQKLLAYLIRKGEYFLANRISGMKSYFKINSLKDLEAYGIETQSYISYLKEGFKMRGYINEAFINLDSESKLQVEEELIECYENLKDIVREAKNDPEIELKIDDRGFVEILNRIDEYHSKMGFFRIHSVYKEFTEENKAHVEALVNSIKEAK